MKKWIGTIAAVALITAAILVGVFWSEGRTSRKLSAEAQPIGLAALPLQWYDSAEEEQVSGHTLTFSYVDAANGVHTETVERITWYDPSKRYKVCYDPEKPDDWKLYESTHECGS